MSSFALAFDRAEGRAARVPCAEESAGDEELIGAYLGADGVESAAAFRTLVDRHGPMVLGVCRHVLGKAHDAEDAFQATFLVLARNAGSIRDRRVLARWLYEVAYRVSVRARTREASRRARESEAAAMSGAVEQHGDDPAWAELRPVLHEEVNRLPEAYRTAVVLCYLEGRTNEEAAALLRWPVGTVKGRLSRARELLRSRLTRRGLALSAAFLMTRLSQNAVFAEFVPATLADATARRSVAAARGLGAAAGVTPRVWELADEAEQAARLAGLLGRGSSTGAGALAAALVALLALTALAVAKAPGGHPGGPASGPSAPARAPGAAAAPGTGGCHSAP